MYSLKHFNFTKPILRSNVDFETATISPLDETTSCPRSFIFSRYCFDSPARNIRIFLRSSSFDLPFRKDVFSFQRLEIGVLNIQASSARRQLHSNCKLPLTPACLTTCCCLATFPFSDVKQTVFALLPGNRMDTFIDIYKYIYIPGFLKT